MYPTVYEDTVNLNYYNIADGGLPFWQLNFLSIVLVLCRLTVDCSYCVRTHMSDEFAFVDSIVYDKCTTVLSAIARSCYRFRFDDTVG